MKVIKKSLSNFINYATMPNKESQRAKAAYPPPLEGLTLQSSERRAMLRVTYDDFFKFCILLVALVGLCYTVFKGRK